MVHDLRIPDQVLVLYQPQLTLPAHLCITAYMKTEKNKITPTQPRQGGLGVFLLLNKHTPKLYNRQKLSEIELR